MGKVRQVWENYLGLWKRLTGWRLFLFYTLHYTILFFFLSYWIFSDFREQGKSFIWKTDGLPQWCTYLTYISRTVRDGIQSLLSGNGLAIPMYDFTLGPVELDLRLEPIQLLAVLWPWDRIDVLYDVLVLVRYYLIGLSFSAFGFYFAQKPLAVMTGAITYVFCGYNLFAGVRHPFYMAAVIWLPLLIVGVEKVFRKESPFLLIGTVFLAVFSNLYFAYMLAILTFLYVLVRFFDYAGKNRLREFLGTFGAFAGYAFIGAALSGIIMVPSLLQNMDTGRVGSEAVKYANLLSYPKAYYQKFLSDITVYFEGAGYWSYLVLSVLAIPAILLLFLKRKRETRTCRILFVLFTGMLLIPYAGFVMSGFSALNNRWCFAYAFLISAIIMFEAEDFTQLDKRTLAWMGLGLLSYAFICYFLINRNYYKEETIVFLAVLSGAYILCRYLAGKHRGMILLFCLVATCLSVCYSSYLCYDADKRNYAAEFIDKGDFYREYEASQFAAFAKSEAAEEDGSFYRVAGNSIPRYRANFAFYYGVNGVAGYSTYYHNRYYDWHKELEMVQKDSFGVFSNLDDRAPLLAQMGVKYFVFRNSGTYPYGFQTMYPYGFQEVEKLENKENDVILENQNWLPIGYTYDSYISREKYDELISLGKQEAQLQSVVIEKALEKADVQEKEIRTTEVKIPYTISAMDGVSWEKGKLKVTKENATMTLEFEGRPKTETYLRIVGLDLTSGSSTRFWSLSVDTDNKRNRARFAADAYMYSPGMKTQLLNMGYSEDICRSMTISFPQKGTYLLEDLEVWSQPVDHYAQYIQALREEPLSNVKTNTRGLTGDISVTKDKILCISIPYSRGWTAYVDGEKAEILQANTAFMGLELTAGDHQIELRYCLPGLRAGMALSVLGAAGLTVCVIYRRKKKCRMKKGEEGENM